jgi:hypothetical protein
MAFGTAPRYSTLSDLRDYLSSNGGLGTAQDGLLTDCLLEAEGFIDAYTRRDFAGTAGTVYYSRWTANVAGPALYLDRDLVELTGLINGDGQTIPVGSVWVEPRNQGPPYRVLRLYSSYVYSWNTDSEITVSGTWGFSTRAPEDIRGAAVRLAAFRYRLKDVGPGDVAGFAEAGETTIAKGLPEEIKFVLAPYRSKSGGVV